MSIKHGVCSQIQTNIKRLLQYRRFCDLIYWCNFFGKNFYQNEGSLMEKKRSSFTGRVGFVLAAACRRLGQRLRPGSCTGVPCARGKTRHRGGDSLHRRHQPALAAGHAKNRHGVRGPVQPPYPAGRTSSAAACALLDRNQGIDSVNGQARSRIAAEYPGAADAGDDNSRKPSSLRGLLPFRAEGNAPPREVLPAGKRPPPFRCTHSFRSARFRDAHAAGIISAQNRRFRGCRPTRRRHKR